MKPVVFGPMRDIPGWPGYKITSDGVAWSFKGRSPRKLKGEFRGPYRAYRLSNGSSKLFNAHALVMLAWVGPRPEGALIRHLNGDPTDNRLSNLAWGTPKQNMADAMEHGTLARGERQHLSKLTVRRVRAMRKARQTGMTLQALADRFGVSKKAVLMVVQGKTWRHA